MLILLVSHFGPYVIKEYKMLVLYQQLQFLLITEIFNDVLNEGAVV